MPPVTQRNARAKLDENMRICGTDPFSGTFSNEVTELVILTVGTAIIETTSEHPFWVKDEGWIRAAELQPSDLVLSKSGAWLPIISAMPFKSEVTIYNFEVDGFHTYLVSDEQILVHNSRRIRGPDDYHGPKPDYHNPGTHVPGHPNFRGGGCLTSILPHNAEELYRKAVPEEDGKTWWSRDADGNYHRYQAPRNGPGPAHWNGSSNSPRGAKPPAKIVNRFMRKCICK